MQDILNDLETAGFFELKFEETGNMTSFISVIIDGKRNRISWASGNINGDENIRIAEDLYKKLQQTINQVSENG